VELLEIEGTVVKASVSKNVTEVSTTSNAKLSARTQPFANQSDMTRIVRSAIFFPNISLMKSLRNFLGFQPLISLDPHPSATLACAVGTVS
jgi:hypothetical protein